MAGIFTRNALNKIMEDENLTPQQRTEQVYSLYGRALDDGYVSKSAAQQAQEAAVEAAKADWEKGQTAPDPKESDEYKALAGEFDAYKAMQAARTSKDFEGVKPKFFETVYGLVDRGEGAKSLQEQLAGIREQYEEYFTPADPNPNPAPGKPAPKVVLPTGGNPVHVYAQAETTYGEPAGLFGINCGHHPMLFIPGASKVPALQQTEGQNAETYAQSQKQRKLERDFRKARLEYAAAKAQGADTPTTRAALDKLHRADDRLNQFEKDTGRRRRREREYGPRI